MYQTITAGRQRHVCCTHPVACTQERWHIVCYGSNLFEVVNGTCNLSSAKLLAMTSSAITTEPHRPAKHRGGRHQARS